MPNGCWHLCSVNLHWVTWPQGRRYGSFTALLRDYGMSSGRTQGSGAHAVCMCTCVHSTVRLWPRVCRRRVFVNTYVCVHAHMFIHACRVHGVLCSCVSMCMRVIYVSLHMCIYGHVYMHIYVCVCGRNDPEATQLGVARWDSTPYLPSPKV